MSDLVGIRIVGFPTHRLIIIPQSMTVPFSLCWNGSGTEKLSFLHEHMSQWQKLCKSNVSNKNQGCFSFKVEALRNLIVNKTQVTYRHILFEAHEDKTALKHNMHK